MGLLQRWQSFRTNQGWVPTKADHSPDSACQENLILHGLQFLQIVSMCSGMGAFTGCIVDICTSMVVSTACREIYAPLWFLPQTSGEYLLRHLEHFLPLLFRQPLI